MRFTVYLTARAIRDLESAREYIRRFAPETADRWNCEILEKLLRLEQNPQSRPLAPEDTEFPFELRQLLIRTRVGANRALFTIVGDQVRVLAIRRPGQPLITRDDIK